jgi:hypothetical protein
VTRLLFYGTFSKRRGVDFGTYFTRVIVPEQLRTASTVCDSEFVHDNDSTNVAYNVRRYRFEGLVVPSGSSHFLFVAKVSTPSTRPRPPGLQFATSFWVSSMELGIPISKE